MKDCIFRISVPVLNLSEADLQAKSSFGESRYIFFLYHEQWLKAVQVQGGFVWQLNSIHYMCFQCVTCGVAEWKLVNHSVAAVKEASWVDVSIKWLASSKHVFYR